MECLVQQFRLTPNFGPQNAERKHVGGIIMGMRLINSKIEVGLGLGNRIL